MKYDLSKEPYNRVVEVLVRCTECNIPEYVPLEDDQIYRLALPSFIASGGDGYDVIEENKMNHNRGKEFLWRKQVKTYFSDRFTQKDGSIPIPSVILDGSSTAVGYKHSCSILVFVHLFCT